MERKKKTQHFYNNKVRHPYSLISEWLSIGNPQGTPLGCSVSRVCMCNLQKTFDCQFLILLMLKFLTTDLYPFFFFIYCISCACSHMHIPHSSHCQNSFINMFFCMSLLELSVFETFCQTLAASRLLCILC